MTPKARRLLDNTAQKMKVFHEEVESGKLTADNPTFLLPELYDIQSAIGLLKFEVDRASVELIGRIKWIRGNMRKF